MRRAGLPLALAAILAPGLGRASAEFTCQIGTPRVSYLLHGYTCTSCPLEKNLAVADHEHQVAALEALIEEACRQAGTAWPSAPLALGTCERPEPCRGTINPDDLPAVTDRIASLIPGAKRWLADRALADWPAMNRQFPQATTPRWVTGMPAPLGGGWGRGGREWCRLGPAGEPGAPLGLGWPDTVVFAPRGGRALVGQTADAPAGVPEEVWNLVSLEEHITTSLWDGEYVRVEDAAWSPDGTRLAIVCNRRDREGGWSTSAEVISSRGARVWTLSPSGAPPEWTPDRVVWSAEGGRLGLLGAGKNGWFGAVVTITTGKTEYLPWRAGASGIPIAFGGSPARMLALDTKSGGIDALGPAGATPVLGHATSVRRIRSAAHPPNANDGSCAFSEGEGDDGDGTASSKPAEPPPAITKALYIYGADDRAALERFGLLPRGRFVRELAGPVVPTEQPATTCWLVCPARAADADRLAAVLSATGVVDASVSPASGRLAIEEMSRLRRNVRIEGISTVLAGGR